MISQNAICDICKKKFQSDWRLKRHKKTYHIQEAEGGVCDICGFTSKVQRNLKRHVRSVHMKSKKCKHCDKPFGTRHGLLNIWKPLLILTFTSWLQILNIPNRPF